MIDREKVLDLVKQYADSAPVGREAKMAIRALGVNLCMLPTTEIVRCDDCKRWPCDFSPDVLDEYDGFCSLGEKMDGDGDES